MFPSLQRSKCLVPAKFHQTNIFLPFLQRSIFPAPRRISTSLQRFVPKFVQSSVKLFICQRESSWQRDEAPKQRRVHEPAARLQHYAEGEMKEKRG